jgi:hypothetical protein
VELAWLVEPPRSGSVPRVRRDSKVLNQTVRARRL